MSEGPYVPRQHYAGFEAGVAWVMTEIVRGDMKRTPTIDHIPSFHSCSLPLHYTGGKPRWRAIPWAYIRGGSGYC